MITLSMIKRDIWITTLCVLALHIVLFIYICTATSQRLSLKPSKRVQVQTIKLSPPKVEVAKKTEAPKETPKVVKKEKKVEKPKEKKKTEVAKQPPKSKPAKKEKNQEQLNAALASLSQLDHSSPTPTATKLQRPTLDLKSEIPKKTTVENAYQNELVMRLRQQLRLPEFGNVVVQLKLDRQGKVLAVEVIEAGSEINKEYILKKIPALNFPGFGANYAKEESQTFRLVLGNEI